MMPQHSPVRVPAYLRGEAGPEVFEERLFEDMDSLAGLVERGRRLGRFWPPSAVEPEAPQPLRRRPTFRIGAREARLFGGLPE